MAGGYPMPGFQQRTYAYAFKASLPPYSTQGARYWSLRWASATQLGNDAKDAAAELNDARSGAVFPMRNYSPARSIPSLAIGASLEGAAGN